MGKIFNRAISLLKKLISLFIKFDTYDIGTSYDPPASFADKLIRYFYARLYQKESFDLRKQILKQYFGASLLFHVKRAIRKLKLGQIPIRIVFIAQEPYTWRVMESLYRACLTDQIFKTYVVNSEFLWQKGRDDCSAFLAKNNIEYLDGFNHKIRFDLLNPDIFVLGSPYDVYRPDHHNPASLLRYAKIVYIPYGIDFGTKVERENKYWFGNDTQKNAWRIFSRSNKTRYIYKKYCGVSSRRIVGAGLPILDQYASGASSSVLPEAIQSASAGKFKILYTPHHTVDGWSTFLRYGAHIRELVEKNKDCFLFFRPHPSLIVRLIIDNLMSENDFYNFFSGERCYLYEGDDYYGLFQRSDMLISDASSILGEYAPARKPIIYLYREDGWDLDDSIRDDILKGYYVASSEDQITAFFLQLKNGDDPMKSERERRQENICKGILNGGAGKRIARYLRNTLA
ncbi:MAG: hypothetical protein C4518_01960 [Desulfobacteraceae bacterium]|nr:MAG: hypothetical protein C4518_01960 [Desulfobacteraceae bacterium]